MFFLLRSHFLSKVIILLLSFDRDESEKSVLKTTGEQLNEHYDVLQKLFQKDISIETGVCSKELGCEQHKDFCKQHKENSHGKKENYKVHYDGCKELFEEVADQLKMPQKRFSSTGVFLVFCDNFNSEGHRNTTTRARAILLVLKN